MSVPEPLFRLFDPEEDVLKINRRLPHWSQAGTLCFITWRTNDSLPQPVLNRWMKERWNWLQAHNIDPTQSDWKNSVAELPQELRWEFHESFSNRWNDLLDQGHGACPLRQPVIANIVAESLQHFHNDRYLLTDFVIMPNHVHTLCAFRNDDALLTQCNSWKHFTAMRINQQLGSKGRFWQQDGFDHLVRSEAQFFGLRKYIAQNPIKANLHGNQFIHYSNASIFP